MPGSQAKSGPPSHIVTITGAAPTLTMSFFLNSVDGWAVGTFMGKGRLASNFLVRTTDGGASWTEFSTGNIQIFDVQFISLEVGFALASEGEHPVSVWRSTNGGASWRQVFSFPVSSGPDAIMALHFTSPAWGFASLGRSVLFITGDGTHFSPHLINGPARPLLTIFQSPAHAIAVGSQSIWTVTAASLATSAVNLAADRTYRLPQATAAFARGRGYGAAIVSASVAFWGASRVWVALQLNRCSLPGCPSLLLLSTNDGSSWKVVSQTGASSMSGIPGITASEATFMATDNLVATGPTSLIGTNVGQFLVRSSNMGATWGTIGTSAIPLADGGEFTPLGGDHFMFTTHNEILSVSHGFRVSQLLLRIQTRAASASP